MRWSGAKGALVSGLCAALAAGGLAAAAQEPLTDETYDPALSEIRLILGDAELHVDARYWPELGEDLEKLFTMFRQIEEFWTERGNDDAVARALASIERLRDIGGAAGEMDQGRARSGVRALRATLSCHDRDQEEAADANCTEPGS